MRLISAAIALVLATGSALAQEESHHAPPAHTAHSAPPRAMPHGPGRTVGRPPGHYSNGRVWAEHPAWQGNLRQLDHRSWRGGHWWHGHYGGRLGWWWIVGPDWYWYAQPVNPYPDPYTPPGMEPGYWYWCDEYQDYYPNVGACPSGWQQEEPDQQ